MLSTIHHINNQLHLHWGLRTRPQGRRTRVRRGGTRGRGKDAADRASVPRRTALCHVASPESGRRRPTRLKSAPIRRPSQAEIQKKKKKKVQTHRFTNLKTPRPLTFRPASLIPSLISLLCVNHCAPSLILVIYLLCVSGSLCECSVLLQPSGVLSLLFS